MLAQADTMNYICNRIFKTAKQNINNLKRYIMKKFTSILAMIMMAAMSLTFVSCDDDEYIADTLWGVWEGDMYVTSEWNGQHLLLFLLNPGLRQGSLRVCFGHRLLD